MKQYVKPTSTFVEKNSNSSGEFSDAFAKGFGFGGITLKRENTPSIKIQNK